jgi:hypothetical protein
MTAMPLTFRTAAPRTAARHFAAPSPQVAA